MPTFEVDDKVEKRTGYRFPGTVRGTIWTEDGKERVVVEMSGYGLLHIYAPENLRRRNGG